MGRTTVTVAAGLLAVSAAAVAFLLLDEQASGGGAEVVQGAGRSAGVMELPPAGAEAPAVPLVADRRLEGADASAGPSGAQAIAGAAPLDVTVRHAQGAPAVGGHVSLHDASGAKRGEGVLDDEGRWTHEGVDGPARLFVVGLTPSHDRFELGEGRGEHELVLADGAYLEGRVLVNGAPPGQPFPLELRGAGSLNALFGEAQGRPPRAQIPGQLTSRMRSGFTTDAGGHFLVSGLVPGEEVELIWPHRYALDEAHPPPFPVAAPAAGLVLSLVRPFMIRGQVVHLDGRPAPEALVTLRLSVVKRSENGSSSHSNSWTDAAVAPDGRFAVAFTAPDEPGDGSPAAAVTTLTMDVVARHDEGSLAKVAADELEPDRDHDLGLLVLQPALRMALAVVDPEGAPVVGAHVRPEARHQQLPSLETDDRGQVEIDLTAADAGCATVVASGYRTEFVFLPAAPPGGPLEVVLTPATTVILRAIGPWDRPEVGDGWEFRMGVQAQDSAWHDATLPDVPGRELGRPSGPDPMRPRPEGFAGSSGSSGFADGTRLHTWGMHVPVLELEGLRPGHALTFVVRVDDAPEAFGALPEDAEWESGEIWLTEGERREVVADLRHLQPGG